MEGARDCFKGLELLEAAVRESRWTSVVEAVNPREWKEVVPELLLSLRQLARWAIPREYGAGRGCT